MNKMFVAFILSIFLYEQTLLATFSIVAVDSVTGEIGSAGATCIDKSDIVNYFGFGFASFMTQVRAKYGAINTQSYYLEKNQQNAYNQLLKGNTANQIIDWLANNDCEQKPWFRQYGVVTLQKGHPEAAAFTGDSCFDYMGQRVGKYYTIQGNLLLGKEVLDSMESYFLKEKRSLKYKLMAALQGAKMVGADKRCEPYGTSTLLAFLKVSKPNADGSDSLFSIGVTTYKSQHAEPIDSLQILFNNKLLGNTSIKEIKYHRLTISTSPCEGVFQIKLPSSTISNQQLFVFNSIGIQILTQTFPVKQHGESISINLSNQPAGVYLVRVIVGEEEYSGKVLMVK